MLDRVENRVTRDSKLLYYPALLLCACEKIDVVIASSCRSKHHAVRVECCSCDRRLSGLVEEAGIGLHA